MAELTKKKNIDVYDEEKAFKQFIHLVVKFGLKYADKVLLDFNDSAKEVRN